MKNISDFKGKKGTSKFRNGFKNFEKILKILKKSKNSEDVRPKIDLIKYVPGPSRPV